MPRSPDLDLGLDHVLRFTCWKPDRKLNPQYDGIPDVEKVGAIIDHPSKVDGSPCSGTILFESEVTAKIAPNNHRWKVESWEPLTLSPSILCSCGDHGFIRGGKWVL